MTKGSNGNGNGNGHDGKKFQTANGIMTELWKETTRAQIHELVEEVETLKKKAAKMELLEEEVERLRERVDELIADAGWHKSP